MTKISDLEERVDRLNETHEPSLTTEEANTVRAFWIQLNYSPEEAEEYSTLDKRREVLYENYLAGKKSLEEQAEWTKITERCTQIAHDIVMARVGRNQSLRDRVWPGLAPRVLRFRELTEKPSQELTGDEKRDLETLLDWFSELQQEALGQSKNQKSRGTKEVSD